MVRASGQSQTLFPPPPIFKVCNCIRTEFCATSSFPLSFVHGTAIPADFHLASLQHSTPPPSPSPSKVKISQSIAQFCSQGHRQERDPSVPSATPRNRSWRSRSRDATKRWRSRALTKGTAPAVSAQRMECRVLNCSRWDRSPVPLAEQKQEQDNFKASPKTGSY